MTSDGNNNQILVAVFAFGDAQFAGSLEAKQRVKPIVGAA